MLHPRRYLASLGTLTAALAGLTLMACGSTTSEPSAPSGGAGQAGAGSGGGGAGGLGSSGQPGAEATGILTTDGQRIVGENGVPVVLRGAAFGNDVWSGRTTPPPFHHDERDFGRLASWGMNAARFYLNYQLFESDSAPFEYSEVGFEWIDQNVTWAKEHGVYLILNMHVPPAPWAYVTLHVDFA